MLNSMDAGVSPKRALDLGPWQSVAIFAAGLVLGVCVMLVARGAQPVSATTTAAAGVPPIPADIQDATPLPTAVPVKQADTAATLQGARPALRVGTASAPVQVVIFSDPRCPYCAQLANGAEAQLRATYVPTGSVAITYRHFPVLGDASVLGSIALECAAQQGKFELFHKLLYTTGAYADRADLERMAAGIALDAASFKACFDAPETRQAVQADLDAGRALGVQGTPTLFINGLAQPGALPWELLRPTIERLKLTPG